MFNANSDKTTAGRAVGHLLDVDCEESERHRIRTKNPRLDESSVAREARTMKCPIVILDQHHHSFI